MKLRTIFLSTILTLVSLNSFSQTALDTLRTQLLDSINLRSRIDHVHDWDLFQPNRPSGFPPHNHYHDASDISGQLSMSQLPDFAFNWSQVIDKPTAFPAISHTHNVSDLVGTLSIGQLPAITWSAISDKPITFPSSVHTHNYNDLINLPTSFTPSAHIHSVADIAGLQTTLNNKAALSHTHVISEITGLQTALDNKAGISWVTFPTTPTATGTVGQFASNGHSIAMTVATNQWVFLERDNREQINSNISLAFASARTQVFTAAATATLPASSVITIGYRIRFIVGNVTGPTCIVTASSGDHINNVNITSLSMNVPNAGWDFEYVGSNKWNAALIGTTNNIRTVSASTTATVSELLGNGVILTLRPATLSTVTITLPDATVVENGLLTVVPYGTGGGTVAAGTTAGQLIGGITVTGLGIALTNDGGRVYRVFKNVIY